MTLSASGETPIADLVVPRSEGHELKQLVDRADFYADQASARASQSTAALPASSATIVQGFGENLKWEPQII